MKFVDPDDVVDRFEGEFPDDRTTWLETTIGDVEQDLMGEVASLRKPLDEIIAQSVAFGDPDRMERVKALVCHKVLDLFRNPDRSTTRSQAMDEFTVTRSYGRSSGSQSATISFTDDELDKVKLRRKRSRIGTIPVQPWRVTC